MADADDYHGEPVSESISFRFTQCVIESIGFGFTLSQPKLIGLIVGQSQRFCQSVGLGIAQCERESVNLMRDAITYTNR